MLHSGLEIVTKLYKNAIGSRTETHKSITNRVKSVTMTYKYVVCGGASYEGYDLPEFATDCLDKAKQYIKAQSSCGYPSDWYTVIDLESLKEVFTTL